MNHNIKAFEHASDGAPSRHGRLIQNNGRWSIEATDGYADGGTYEVLPLARSSEPDASNWEVGAGNSCRENALNSC
jgi:hypothetical protein